MLYLGQNNSRSKEAVDSPTENTEHWCHGSCCEEDVVFVWGKQIKEKILNALRWRMGNGNIVCGVAGVV